MRGALLVLWGEGVEELGISLPSNLLKGTFRVGQCHRPPTAPAQGSPPDGSSHAPSPPQTAEKFGKDLVCLLRMPEPPAPLQEAQLA